MAASVNGHVEVVDKLLQYGATVDLQKEVHTFYVHTQCKRTNAAPMSFFLPENTHGT